MYTGPAVLLVDVVSGLYNDCLLLYSRRTLILFRYPSILRVVLEPEWMPPPQMQTWLVWIYPSPFWQYLVQNWAYTRIQAEGCLGASVNVLAPFGIMSQSDPSFSHRMLWCAMLSTKAATRKKESPGHRGGNRAAAPGSSQPWSLHYF